MGSLKLIRVSNQLSERNTDYTIVLDFYVGRTSGSLVHELVYFSIALFRFITMLCGTDIIL